MVFITGIYRNIRFLHRTAFIPDYCPLEAETIGCCKFVR